MSSGEHRRVRNVLEVIGFTIAVAAFGVSIIGTFQNAASLDGLRISLEREHIASVLSTGISLCADPSGEITGGLETTVLTNVGRLPITIVHVGTDEFVNDFTYVRLDEGEPTPKRGAFRLDVGDAVMVQFSVRGTRFTSSVIVRLSDGRAISTDVLGGDGKWPAVANASGALENDGANCPAGSSPTSIPLQDLLDK